MSLTPFDVFAMGVCAGAGFQLGKRFMQAIIHAIVGALHHYKEES